MDFRPSLDIKVDRELAKSHVFRNTRKKQDGSSNRYSINNQEADNQFDLLQLSEIQRDRNIQFCKLEPLLDELFLASLESIDKEEMAERVVKILQLPLDQRTNDDINYLYYYMRNDEFVKKTVNELGIQVCLQCLQHMQHEFYNKAEYVFKEGEKGHKFYIVVRGAVRVIFNLHKDNLVYIKQVNLLRNGQSFGELALQQPNLIRSASIQCNAPSDLGVLERHYYLKFFTDIHQKKFEDKANAIANCPLFRLLAEERYFKTVVYHFREQHCTFKQIVYREGDKVDSVYVIKSGRFKLVKKIFLKDNSLSDSHKHSPELVHMHSSIHAERARSYIDVAVLESGASFGEDEIMRKSDHRFYTAICDSSEGIILRIEKNDFLGKIFHIYKDKDRRDIRRSEKFKISIREKQHKRNIATKQEILQQIQKLATTATAAAATAGSTATTAKASSSTENLLSICQEEDQVVEDVAQNKDLLRLNELVKITQYDEKGNTFDLTQIETPNGPAIAPTLPQLTFQNTNAIFQTNRASLTQRTKSNSVAQPLPKLSQTLNNSVLILGTSSTTPRKGILEAYPTRRSDIQHQGQLQYDGKTPSPRASAERSLSFLTPIKSTAPITEQNVTNNKCRRRGVSVGQTSTFNYDPTQIMQNKEMLLQKLMANDPPNLHIYPSEDFEPSAANNNYYCYSSAATAAGLPALHSQRQGRVQQQTRSPAESESVIIDKPSNTSAAAIVQPAVEGGEKIIAQQKAFSRAILQRSGWNAWKLSTLRLFTTVINITQQLISQEKRSEYKGKIRSAVNTPRDDRESCVSYLHSVQPNAEVAFARNLQPSPPQSTATAGRTTSELDPHFFYAREHRRQPLKSGAPGITAYKDGQNSQQQDKDIL